MKKQILVPLDGSALSERAIPHAVAHAHAMCRSLILVRAAPPPVTEGAIAWSAPPSVATWETWQTEIDVAQNYLWAAARRLEAEGLGIETAVLETEPAQGIINYAETHPEVAMIAMSTHGRSGLNRWVFGSVAERVIHAAPVPTLIVRAHGEVSTHGHGPDEEVHAQAQYRTIVVPLDGSEFAAQALNPANTVAGVLGATLVLVCAAPERPIYLGGVGMPPVEIEWQDEAAHMQAYLAEKAAELKAEGLKVETQVVYGPPAQTILDVCHNVGADLVVMATHGRSGFQRLWLGSVALKVLHSATQPLLLIRSKERVEMPAREYAEATLGTPASAGA